MIGMRTRVENDGITAESVMTDAPKWAAVSGWDAASKWYRVTLEYDDRTLTVPFGMGSGLTDDPTAEDVINCLVSDAATYDNAGSFEEWADELGFDSDSRKAYATYQQVEAQAAHLRAFLGEQYDAYLYETEGL